MKTLTLRSKITVRWTTNPADLGYGGTPSGWKEGRGETMSLRRASGFAWELDQMVGPGTYKAIEYRHGKRVVDISEIEYALSEAEYAKEKGGR
jgi:hypothetical protein